MFDQTIEKRAELKNQTTWVLRFPYRLSFSSSFFSLLVVGYRVFLFKIPADFSRHVRERTLNPGYLKAGED